jgi:Mg2+-importing ATPase
LLLGTLIVIAIGSYLPYSPFAAKLGMVPLPFSFWIWIAGFIVCYAVLCHLVKTWFFNKFGAD